MCEVWQSQIYESTSDGVTTDVLAAMNRVTLDIVGLAGKPFCRVFATPLPRPAVPASGLKIANPDLGNCVFPFFFYFQGSDTTLTL